MRTINGTLLTAARKRQTHFRSLVTLTQVGGTALYVTDADRDIVYAGHTYSSRHGCNLTQIRTVLGASTESVGIDFLIKPTGITGASIEAGTWDNADAKVELIDFTHTEYGTIVLFAGYVVSSSYQDRATATLSCQPYSGRGYLIADEVYSSNCRTDFGDERCRVSLDGKSVDTTVEGLGNLQKFFVADRSDDDRWNAGLASFTSGDNAGFNVEIADYNADGTVILRGLTPFPVGVGDTLTLYQGCDKTPAMCTNRYANILNFRGEPFTIAPWIKTTAYKGSTDTSGSGGGSTYSLDKITYLVSNVITFDGTTYSNDVRKLFGKVYDGLKPTAPHYPGTVNGSKEGWTDEAIAALSTGDAGKYFIVAAESLKMSGMPIEALLAAYVTDGGKPSYVTDGGNTYYFGSVCPQNGPIHTYELLVYVDSIDALSEALH